MNAYLSFYTSRIICSSRTTALVYLSIPLLLSSFIHLWNPIGFPAVFVDEGHYMRRAMHVLVGLGPQESAETYDYPYDHPYFGQIFLASLLAIIGYPDSLISNPADDKEIVASIEELHFIPRMLMGTLAIFDTFILYKIAERRYSRKVAFIAATIFAVMPITWSLRMIVLESMLLPFLLSSLLFAVYCRRKYPIQERKTDNYNLNIDRNAIVPIILPLISGIFLGLAILTKVSVLSLIPAIGFLVYANTRSWRSLAIWIIPVIIIPLIWPAYLISIGEHNSWLDGIKQQADRKDSTLVEFLRKIFNIDPFFLALFIAAVIFAEIKKDYLILLWTISYLIFVASMGAYFRHFHIIILTPVLSIATAKLIVYLSSKISSERIQKLLLSGIVSSIVIFGFLSTLLLITTNLNSTYFDIYRAIAEYLPKTNTENGNSNHDNKITVIGQDNIRSYVWIPKYIQDKDHYYKDAFPSRFVTEPIKTDKILLIEDRRLSRDISDENKTGTAIEKIRSIDDESETVANFRGHWPYDKDIYPYTSLHENYPIGRIEFKANYE
jgi:hypothetical protein